MNLLQHYQQYGDDTDFFKSVFIGFLENKPIIQAALNDEDHGLDEIIEYCRTTQSPIPHYLSLIHGMNERSIMDMSYEDFQLALRHADDVCAAYLISLVAKTRTMSVKYKEHLVSWMNNHLDSRTTRTFFTIISDRKTYHPLFLQYPNLVQAWVDNYVQATRPFVIDIPHNHTLSHETLNIIFHNPKAFTAYDLFTLIQIYDYAETFSLEYCLWFHHYYQDGEYLHFTKFRDEMTKISQMAESFNISLKESYNMLHAPSTTITHEMDLVIS